MVQPTAEAKILSVWVFLKKESKQGQELGWLTIIWEAF